MRNEKCNFKGELLLQLIKIGLDYITLECFTVDFIISPFSDWNCCLRAFLSEQFLRYWNFYPFDRKRPQRIDKNSIRTC